MTQYTPAQLREFAETLEASVSGYPVEDAATALRSLADQLEQPLSHPKSIEAPVVFARVLDPQELRVMLQSLQGGEMSVARSIEIMEFWLDGNYSDDQVPPMPDDSTLLTDDEFPVLRNKWWKL